MTYVLDTNIITALLKGDERVKNRIQSEILSGKDIFISAICYYEIKRGLLAICATKKLCQLPRPDGRGLSLEGTFGWLTAPQ